MSMVMRFAKLGLAIVVMSGCSSSPSHLSPSRVESSLDALIKATKYCGPDARGSNILPSEKLSVLIGEMPDLTAAEIDDLCGLLVQRNVNRHYDIYIAFLLYMMRLYDLSPKTLGGDYQEVSDFLIPGTEDKAWPWVRSASGQFQLLRTVQIRNNPMLPHVIVLEEKVDGKWERGLWATIIERKVPRRR